MTAGGSIRTCNPCTDFLAFLQGFGYFAWVDGKNVGRGKRIRTSGPCLPKTVLYQAELFPDRAETAFWGGPVRQECAYRDGVTHWQAGNMHFFDASVTIGLLP